MAEQNKRSEQSVDNNSKYPHQQVWQMTGGHRLVVSNEKGKEAVRFFHPSGSYFEFQPDGKVTAFTVGENKVYNKGGVTLSIDENNDVQVAGHNKLYVAGGGHIQVNGDVDIVAGGKANLALPGGSLGISMNGNMFLATSGKMIFNAQGGVDFQGSEFKVTAPMKLEGNIDHTGDMKTAGVHTDNNGLHVG